tara:strand:+ start:578 stop:958 length:381 start_codon:yes stop_codon:yes gene_type:complete
MNYLHRERKVYSKNIRISKRSYLDTIIKEQLGKGIIFTSYNLNKKNIIIGFCQSKELFKELTFDYRYEIIATKSGTKNDLKRTKVTLKELGYDQLINENEYSYSYTFLRHLNTLGWPVGSVKRLKK